MVIDDGRKGEAMEQGNCGTRSIWGKASVRLVQDFFHFHRHYPHHFSQPCVRRNGRARSDIDELGKKRGKRGSFD